MCRNIKNKAVWLLIFIFLASFAVPQNIKAYGTNSSSSDKETLLASTKDKYSIERTEYL